MIPNLSEIAERFGIGPAAAALVVAALFTAIMLVAQSVSGWFDDRDS